MHQAQPLSVECNVLRPLGWAIRVWSGFYSLGLSWFFFPFLRCVIGPFLSFSVSLILVCGSGGLFVGNRDCSGPSPMGDIDLNVRDGTFPIVLHWSFAFHSSMPWRLFCRMHHCKWFIHKQTNNNVLCLRAQCKPEHPHTRFGLFFVFSSHLLSVVWCRLFIHFCRPLIFYSGYLSGPKDYLQIMRFALSILWKLTILSMFSSCKARPTLQHPPIACHPLTSWPSSPVVLLYIPRFTFRLTSIDAMVTAQRVLLGPNQGLYIVLQD